MKIKIEFDTQRIKELREYRKTTLEELNQAINLIKELPDENIEPQKINIDRISTGTPSKERLKIESVKRILTHLEEKVGKTIPLEEIISEGQKQDISEEFIEDFIEKLKRQGQVFEPKAGFICQLEP